MHLFFLHFRVEYARARRLASFRGVSRADAAIATSGCISGDASGMKFTHSNDQSTLILLEYT